jgi:hypothetical protein
MKNSIRPVHHSPIQIIATRDVKGDTIQTYHKTKDCGMNIVGGSEENEWSMKSLRNPDSFF